MITAAWTMCCAWFDSTPAGARTWIARRPNPQQHPPGWTRLRCPARRVRTVGREPSGSCSRRTSLDRGVGRPLCAMSIGCPNGDVNEWIAPLFGFAGTLLGALVALGGVLSQQRQVAKAARAAARDEALIAARILRADVDFARTRLLNAVSNMQYWSPSFALPRESWNRYREVVARDLAISDWSKVSHFFRSSASLEAGAEFARAAAGEDRPVLTQRMVDVMESAAERAGEAAEVLDAFTGGETPSPGAGGRD